MTSESERVELKGVITPAGWDDDDDVTEITISTDDEDEYLIAGDHVGYNLLGLLHERVRLTGRIEEDAFGDQVIHVETYEILEDLR